jgi:DNA replication protein DnaC
VTTCTNPSSPPSAAPADELDEATRVRLRELSQRMRRQSAEAKGQPERLPLLQRLNLEERQPASEPKDRASEEYARWRASALTTYGYPLGRVEPFGHRFAHNPFGFPSWAPHEFAQSFTRHARQQRTQAVALWEEAHAGATSLGTGHTGAQALADDWAEAIRLDEARQAEALAKAADAQRAEDLRARRERLPELLVERGLPALAVIAWREGLRESPGLRAARECLAQLALPHGLRVTPFLLLTGTPGTGKTTAVAVALLEAALEAVEPEEDGEAPRTGGTHRGAPSFAFWSAAHLARRPLFGAEATEALERAKRVEVLVIDDLGVEFMAENGPWQATLDEVLNARYEGARLTLLTTNLTWQPFAERYGARIADRLRQVCRVVSCGSTSMRQRTPPSK